MDCNAQFSEIFQSKNFGKMNDFEKTLLSSMYRFETVCEKCNINVSLDSDIFVQYVTSSDIKNSPFHENNWPQYITHTNSAPCRLQCPNCETLIISPSPSLVLPTEILFVEFASDAINVLEFYDEIEIVNLNFKLKGLVRCSSNHFTCAIYEFQHWCYFDDLCDSVRLFDNLQQLFLKYPDNWFFGIYGGASAIENLQTQSPCVKRDKKKTKIGT